MVHSVLYRVINEYVVCSNEAKTIKLLGLLCMKRQHRMSMKQIFCFLISVHSLVIPYVFTYKKLNIFIYLNEQISFNSNKENNPKIIILEILSRKSRTTF